MTYKALVPVFPNPAFHINFDDFSCRPAAGRQYFDSLTPKKINIEILYKKNLNKQSQPSSFIKTYDIFS